MTLEICSVPLPGPEDDNYDQELSPGSEPAATPQHHVLTNTSEGYGGRYPDNFDLHGRPGGSVNHDHHPFAFPAPDTSTELLGNDHAESTHPPSASEIHDMLSSGDPGFTFDFDFGHTLSEPFPADGLFFDPFFSHPDLWPLPLNGALRSPDMSPVIRSDACPSASASPPPSVSPHEYSDVDAAPLLICFQRGRRLLSWSKTGPYYIVVTEPAPQVAPNAIWVIDNSVSDDDFFSCGGFDFDTNSTGLQTLSDNEDDFLNDWKLAVSPAEYMPTTSDDEDDAEMETGLVSGSPQLDGEEGRTAEDRSDDEDVESGGESGGDEYSDESSSQDSDGGSYDGGFEGLEDEYDLAAMKVDFDTTSEESIDEEISEHPAIVRTMGLWK